MSERSGIGSILTNTTRRITSVTYSCGCDKGISHKMIVPAFTGDGKVVHFFQKPIALICVYCGLELRKEYLWEDIPNA